jgi:plastocyanin
LVDGAANAGITLYRGARYVFSDSASGHPFWIKIAPSTGTGNAFSNSATGNGASTGSIVFDVPANAPGTLYYSCQIHSVMTGVISVLDGENVHLICLA